MSVVEQHAARGSGRHLRGRWTSPRATATATSSSASRGAASCAEIEVAARGAGAGARRATAAAGADDVAAHVGYYLIDDGRRALERALALRHGIAGALRSGRAPLPLLAYLGCRSR